MARLIDADALWTDIMMLPHNGDMISSEEVEQAIKDAPTVDAVEVVRWTPVTERLPEENGNYIVTACDEGCSYGEGIWYDTVVVVAEYYNGSWTWDENGTEYDLCGIVTHWMPLPQPPKGE